MARLVRQDFPELNRRILAIKELPDGSIAVVGFSDHVDPDDLGIANVSRFRLMRRSA